MITAMEKIIMRTFLRVGLALLVAVAPYAAYAADNSTLPVAVGTEVFANKDIGGVKFPKQIPHNSSGFEIFTSSVPGQVTGANGTFPSTQSGTWNITTLTTLTGGGVASGATDSGNPVKVGGKYNSSPIALLDGQRGDLQVDATGALKVASHAVTNAGTFATQSAVTAAASSYSAGAFVAGVGVDGWDLTQGAKADTVCATDSGTCSLLALLKRTNANLTTLNSTAGNAVPAGTNNIGSVGLAAGTTGGCTPAKTLSAATTNATNIKASAGTLCKLVVINTTTTLYYLKLYDKATAPTCNSDTVLATYAIPYGASNTGGGITVPLGAFGEAYTAGIGFCLTAGIADNDNAAAATGVTVSYAYK